MEGWLDQNFEPNGPITGYKHLRSARSVLDAAAKIMLIEYRKRVDLAVDPGKVDITKLRGAEGGAFRTYERMKIDDWDIEQVLADAELGGFVQGKKNINATKKTNNEGGVMCKKCGSIMDQIKPNCFECSKCSNNIGGCTL